MAKQTHSLGIQHSNRKTRTTFRRYFVVRRQTSLRKRAASVVVCVQIIQQWQRFRPMLLRYKGVVCFWAMFYSSGPESLARVTYPLFLCGLKLFGAILT